MIPLPIICNRFITVRIRTKLVVTTFSHLQMMVLNWSKHSLLVLNYLLLITQCILTQSVVKDVGFKEGFVMNIYVSIVLNLLYGISRKLSLHVS